MSTHCSSPSPASLVSSPAIPSPLSDWQVDLTLGVIVEVPRADASTAAEAAEFARELFGELDLSVSLGGVQLAAELLAKVVS